MSAIRIEYGGRVAIVEKSRVRWVDEHGTRAVRGLGVMPAGERTWVPCEDCGSSRPAHMRGRHGAMLPARGLTGPGAADWPRCEHGAPFWENCRARPVVPPCCLGVVP